MTKRKTWVLDTGTKGTGAEMVPLDKVLRDPAGPGAAPAVAARKSRPRPARTAPPREPRRFKVVDVMTALVLGDDLDARGTLALLRDAGSWFDVRVYVWQPRAPLAPPDTGRAAGDVGAPAGDRLTRRYP